MFLKQRFFVKQAMFLTGRALVDGRLVWMFGKVINVFTFQGAR